MCVFFWDRSGKGGVAHNILPLDKEEQPKDEEIEMEEDDGDLDIGIIPGHICCKGNKHNKDQNYDVEPENRCIYGIQVIEMTVMYNPETREHKKCD
jgi:hypothetical protein